MADMLFLDLRLKTTLQDYKLEVNIKNILKYDKIEQKKQYNTCFFILFKCKLFIRRKIVMANQSSKNKNTKK